ncbi:ATP-binding protein [Acetobacteraceae bacterium]|nr:ATP-binding protein [Acetobacteraceae bacterium]
MLSKFTIENFSSINEKQVLDLNVDPEQADLHGWAVPATEENSQHYPDIATLAVLYGANGAGKSTILSALKSLSFIAYASQTEVKADENFPNFSWFGQDKPTKMSVEFLRPNGHKVEYEISFTNEAILFEKLEINNEEIFKREEKNQIVSEQLESLPFRNLRRNASLLSFAASYGHLEDIHSLFNFALCYFDGSKPNAVQEKDIPKLKQAFKLISDLDLGISDISFQEIPGKEEKHALFAHHRLPTGEVKKLLWHSESDGTAHLLSVMFMLQNILNKGGILLADEIEEKLHPLAVFRLLELFNDPETNPHKAQLICTSHLPDIMDEVGEYNIFLTEKRHQATRLWRLDDDKHLDESQSFRAAYLQKIYGGVPRIGRPADQAN